MEKNVRKRPYYLLDKHLSVGIREYLRTLNNGTKPIESLPVIEARKVFKNIQSSIDVDLSGIEEEKRIIEIGNFKITLNITRPKEAKEKLPAFIFLHGGGWILGDYSTHKRLICDLVRESGFTSIFVNYSRSPEVKFPQALNEIYAATKWIAENGDKINIDGKKLAVIGNSVGGNMAIAMCMKAKESSGPEIKCQILLWPYSNTSTAARSYIEYGEQRFLTASLMEWMKDSYISKKEDDKNPLISPAIATKDKLQGLPPTLIQVAENDILRDDGEKLGRHLDEAGVYVTTIRYNGTIHDWGLLNGFAKLSSVESLIIFSAAMLKKYLN